LANFLHASTDILEDFGLDLYGFSTIRKSEL
jgi:hypothetical protein